MCHRFAGIFMFFIHNAEYLLSETTCLLTHKKLITHPLLHVPKQSDNPASLPTLKGSSDGWMARLASTHVHWDTNTPLKLYLGERDGIKIVYPVRYYFFSSSDRGNKVSCPWLTAPRSSRHSHPLSPPGLRIYSSLPFIGRNLSPVLLPFSVLRYYP